MAQANATKESWDDPTPSSFWPNYISGNDDGVNLNEKPSLFGVEKAASHNRPLYSLKCGDFNNSANLPIIRCFSIECFKNYLV